MWILFHISIFIKISTFWYLMENFTGSLRLLDYCIQGKTNWNMDLYPCNRALFPDAHWLSPVVRQDWLLCSVNNVAEWALQGWASDRSPPGWEGKWYNRELFQERHFPCTNFILSQVCFESFLISLNQIWRCILLCRLF